MLPLLKTIADVASKLFTNDVGKTGEALASGDIKKMAGAAYDTFAPIPVQAALYSPEAQAITGMPGTNPLMTLLRALKADSVANAVDRSALVRRGSNWIGEREKQLPLQGHPSFMIANRESYPTGDIPFLHGGLLLPRPEFLDKSLSTGRGHLANRDIYSYRSGESPFWKKYWADKQNISIPRGSEYQNLASFDPGHALSIFAGPEFKSLKEWEASPYGMKLLQDYQKADSSQVRSFRDAIETAMRRHGIYSKDTVDMAAGKPTGKISNSLQERLLEAARKSPSDYAELKYRADFPINAETTVAIGYNPDYGSATTSFLRDKFAKVGVPVYEFKESDQIWDLIDEAFAMDKPPSWVYDKRFTGGKPGLYYPGKKP